MAEGGSFAARETVSSESPLAYLLAIRQPCLHHRQCSPTPLKQCPHHQSGHQPLTGLSLSRHILPCPESTHQSTLTSLQPRFSTSPNPAQGSVHLRHCCLTAVP